MDLNEFLSYEDIHLQVMMQNDFDHCINNSENCYLIFYKYKLVNVTRYYAEYDTKKS